MVTVDTTDTTDSFSVKTEVFEGPLDLLLDLVEKRKLLINDISLAKVTDEYMQYVSKLEQLSLPHTTQFIQLAATLLLIKSKSLLFVLDLTDEEESNIKELESRLKRYKIYRDLGVHISNQFGTSYSRGRTFRRSKRVVFTPDAYTNTATLHEALWSVIASLPITERAHEAHIADIITLESMIERITERIQQNEKLHFSEVIEANDDERTVVVGFLAILESTKQGRINATQAHHFTDILLSKDASTPRYE